MTYLKLIALAAIVVASPAAAEGSRVIIDQTCGTTHCRTTIDHLPPLPNGPIVAPYQPPGTIMICSMYGCAAVPVPRKGE